MANPHLVTNLIPNLVYLLLRVPLHDKSCLYFEAWGIPATTAYHLILFGRRLNLCNVEAILNGDVSLAF